MEPIAIVTALFAVLVILGRGPLLVSPTATLAVYRRLLSTPSRIRAIGGMLALLAAALTRTAHPARADHGGIAIGIETLGWLLAAAAVWLVVTPRLYQQLAYSILDAVSDPAALRAIGAMAVAIGLGLLWLAFFVL